MTSRIHALPRNPFATHTVRRQPRDWMLVVTGPHYTLELRCRAYGRRWEALIVRNTGAETHRTHYSLSRRDVRRLIAPYAPSHSPVTED